MTKLTLPMERMPSVISESIAVTLKPHELSLPPAVIRELGRNLTQALLSLDVTGGLEEPTAADLLAVGQTLRALAAAGRPNPATAPALARVGSWLSDLAMAEVSKGGKAA